MEELNFDNIAKAILSNLKENAANIVTVSNPSPRIVGDKVQDYLGDVLSTILSPIKVKTDFGRRSMEDMAFTDQNNNYYAVDVKTHNVDLKFSRPNLISVERLANFYHKDNNNFCILLVSYRIPDGKISFQNCVFKRIENFNWNCLSIGALGCGQIQIANANKELSYLDNDSNTRKSWMLTFCKELSIFYNKEQSKIINRKKKIDSINSYWKAK